MSSLISLLGIVVLLGIAYLLSNNRKAINFRTVFGALTIQVSLGAFILYVPIGRDALLAMANGVSKVISYGNEGIKFLFGALAGDKVFEVFGGEGFIFAVRVLPAIVFFSALISLLYWHHAMGNQDYWWRITANVRDFSGGIYVGSGKYFRRSN